MTDIELQYKVALESIADHFNGCDLTGDDSANYVVKKAARALGWTISKDEYDQIKYIKHSLSVNR